jgi:Ras-related protein Rab-1A
MENPFLLMAMQAPSRSGDPPRTRPRVSSKLVPVEPPPPIESGGGGKQPSAPSEPDPEEVVTSAEPQQRYDRSYKICIAGMANVGKTSLLVRYCMGKFTKEKAATIGVEFHPKVLQIGSTMIQLTLWDTAGQERFQALTQNYFRHAHGLICVFDVNVLTSFDTVERYIDQYYMACGVRSDQIRYAEDTPPVLLVANKMDVEYPPENAEFLMKGRMALLERARALALAHNWYMADVSALTGSGVETAFNSFVQEINRHERMHSRLNTAKTAVGVATAKPPASIRASVARGSMSGVQAALNRSTKILVDSQTGAPKSAVNMSTSTAIQFKEEPAYGPIPPPPLREPVSSSTEGSSGSGSSYDMAEVIRLGTELQQQKRSSGPECCTVM